MVESKFRDILLFMFMNKNSFSLEPINRIWYRRGKEALSGDFETCYFALNRHESGN